MRVQCVHASKRARALARVSLFAVTAAEVQDPALFVRHIVSVNFLTTYRAQSFGYTDMVEMVYL